MKDKVLSIIKSIVEKKDFDMKRMESLINRTIQQQLSKLEEQPGSYFCYPFINDFLYGTSVEQMREVFNQVDHYRALLSYDIDRWMSLISKYILDRPYVFIRGMPSEALSVSMAEEEKERIGKARF